MMNFWPCNPPERAAKAALVVIDMQVDFCAPGGWVDQLGEDVNNTRSIIPAVAEALTIARAAGLAVFHTREGHKPDLSDLPANKQWRTRIHGLGIGDEGASGRILVRGEPGFEIVPELAPLAGEMVIDKPGKSGFHATDFDARLTALGITHLIVIGVTSDCCVQSTFRDGFERGYECVILEDCTAAVETANHEATMDILKAFGGRWGTVSDLASFRAAVEALHG
ncbi:nicotinamidase-related amidase [Rhizobium sp. ERR 922]|uniref:Cysteine hydrolase n=1 Tax=Rhizobium dioscoreae TaxID=2653122 RepID=A0ABQ0ZA00_9HYPH|nr:MULTISPECIES: isochorismatase family cysteine hydrolase [Rhizobium]MCZ3374425.1 cysteine hydrolase [Rhizobium sp. AG207R]TWB49037.1 nicotinamidase-related amidase [Rhizobium sp. ERR 922]TWB91569.1 nicotinamidase-related amidase [Rhizobium sp. ERR 942]GES52078.1 cysteine hydrolase [Rhizobium dioscoreae]GLU83203.1 cysteine hydrolase [Rhizobium sp. NBRC 114257]